MSQETNHITDQEISSIVHLIMHHAFTKHPKQFQLCALVHVFKEMPGITRKEVTSKAQPEGVSKLAFLLADISYGGIIIRKGVYSLGST